MNRVNRLTAWGLALTLGAGIVATPIAARASEEGQRNTALGLSAAAAALLLTQKNKLPGIIAGAGAAYAWKKNQDSIEARHRREREWGYDRRDRNDYRNRDNSNYRDNSSYRDDYNYRNERRDPVSGRYTGNNRDRYRDDYRDSDDNRYRDNNRNRDNNRYRNNDDCDNDGPPYGRALGYRNNKKR